VANAGSDPERVFGRRMKQERLLRGWRQEDLAGRVGLIPSAISKAEAGRRLIRLNEAAAIAAALGVPLAALLTDASEREARIAEMRAEAVRLSDESDEALRRAVYYRNAAAELAGEQE